MWFWSLLLFLVSSSWAADHDLFKNCSRVDFCNDLRDRQPSNDYSITASNVTYDSTTLTATLTSASGFDLTLTLTALQESSFRLKIKESNSKRYELIDSLDGEPETLDFDDVQTDQGSVTLTTASGSNVAKVTYSPFSIEFSKDGTVEVVFDGSRLYMSEGETQSPFSFGVSFPKAVQLYGLHEHCETLALKNTKSEGDPYRLRNADVPNFETDSPMAVYGAVPVLYGFSGSSSSGIFLHNAAQQWVDTTSSSDGTSEAYFMAEAGTLDLFVFLGPSLIEVVRQYTRITGRAYIPQIWTLGYQQSRYGYDTQEKAKDVITKMDEGDFPVDSVWLDIDYTDGFRYFTWNPETFSDPIDLQNTLDSTNRKLVTIVDPHIKVDQGYNVYDGASEKGLFVKNPDGTNFEGSCWPGLSSWMDFLNPEARDFYGSMYSYDNFSSTTPVIAGIWNDMNEPSVFDNSFEMSFSSEVLHIGGVKHVEIHNIYGLLHTKSTNEGLMKRDDSSMRPFILTRSHFAGTQRFSAIWTGDNTADWPYLHATFQECLNANLLGIVFCGSDVGGFLGDPTDELLERWYQAGAWVPFYRAHSNKNSREHEPYNLPEDSQDIVRESLKLRYKHLPVWYTLFYEHTKSGEPLVRPLFYHYPDDANVLAIDDQLLVGRDILVKAVTAPGVTSVDMYFPGGEDELWSSIYTYNVQAGTGLVNVDAPRDHIPIYYRAGAAILLKDVPRRNTFDMTDDAYTLYATYDQNNHAQGTLYIDDGVSFKYRDAEDFKYLRIEVDGNSYTFTQLGGSGNFNVIINVLKLRKIVELPSSGKKGRFEEIVVTTDANGVPLKDIKINSGVKVIF